MAHFLYTAASAGLILLAWRGIQAYSRFVFRTIDEEHDKPRAYRSALFGVTLNWEITFVALIGLSYLAQAMLGESGAVIITNILGVFLLGLIGVNFFLLVLAVRVGWRWYAN